MRPLIFYQILLILFILACNRDSPELAPSKFEFEKPQELSVNLYHTEVLRANLIKKTDQWRKTTDLVIRNLSGSQITKLQFYLETCVKTSNYTNCGRIIPFILPDRDTLKVNGAVTFKVSADYFFDADAKESIYITTLNGVTQNLLTSVPSHSPVTATFDNVASARKDQGRFFFLADRSCVIRLSRRVASVNTYYLITGDLSANGVFSGAIRLDGNPSQEYDIDGTISGSSKLTLVAETAAAAINISSVVIDL